MSHYYVSHQVQFLQHRTLHRVKLKILLHHYFPHLHPNSGVNLHERVRNENDVHAVENGGEDGVPKAHFSLEVEHADHLLSLRVIAGGG